jgi:hypothetical protein
MSVFKRGDVWWYKFRFAGQLVRESAKTSSKTVAREAERLRRRALEEGYNAISDRREDRIKTVRQVAAEFMEEYDSQRMGTSAVMVLSGPQGCSASLLILPARNREGVRLVVVGSLLLVPM